MLNALIRRQIERLRRGSARWRPYSGLAAPILGLALGIGLGFLILVGAR
jgi:hypothetical protein